MDAARLGGLILQHRTSLRATLALLAAANLGGCAALAGSAKPVVAIDTRVAYATRFPEEKVYKAFFDTNPDCRAGVVWPECRNGMSQMQYRNMVAALYMSAADARYEQFRRALSLDAKGTAFGANLGILLMNGISVVSGNEARRALAASTAVLAGGQAAVSKDLFIEKALPAVLSTMDGARSEAKAAIVANLRLDADRYSLPDALGDIRRLEDQAHLDAALQKLNATASAGADEEQAKLDVAYEAPLLGKDLSTRIFAWQDDVEALSDENFGKALEALKIPVGADRAESQTNFRNWVGQYVAGSSALDDAVSKTSALTGKDKY
jgi:hypothetical protein